MREAVQAGDVAMIGIIQEQHPDRCRLFAQWQGFDWPILHDPLNVIPTRAVPVVLAIDEHGVVRSTRPKPDWVLGEFLKTDYPEPERVAAPLKMPDLTVLKKTAVLNQTPESWGEFAQAIVLWGGKDRLNDAIAAYDRAIELDGKDGHLRFGRGVALRMRYESSARRDHDFQAAVNSWGAALEIDPNHYIYRRRIQQYGPRLMKPYPFYDWVPKARETLTARGEKPVPLLVEPSGAEYATPTRAFIQTASGAEPDAAGRIRRDADELVSMNAVTVPAKVAPGRTTRVHLEFRVSKQTHWNNESEPVHVWIDAPEGWQLQRNLFELPPGMEAESKETRHLEFEVKVPADAKPRTLTGYALYYVCEEAGGQCLYLRRDIEVLVRVAE